MTEKVTINKIDYPMYFGFNALRLFSKNTGLGFSELSKLGTNMDIDQAVQLIWAGLKDGARKSKTEFTLDIEQLADQFDDDMEALSRCIEIFAEFQAKQGGDQGNVKAGA